VDTRQASRAADRKPQSKGPFPMRLPIRYASVAFLVLACDSNKPAPTALAPSADQAFSRVVSAVRLGEPLAGLTGAQRAQFEAGSDVFNRVFTPKTGLGPVFNANSCATCHASGGAGTQVEIHGTVYNTATGACDELDSVGGFVFETHATPQLTAATGLTGEPIPSYAQLGHVSTPQLFGRGLLEAVSDATIKELAEREKAENPRAAGRVAVLSGGGIGRFGRKGNAATLDDFMPDAFLYEIGITTPGSNDSLEKPIGDDPVPPGVDLAKDPELSAAGLNATTDFVRYLAPPPGGALDGGKDSHDDDAEDVFRRTGCATCHVPLLETGSSPVRALSHRRVRAFTDLLLHDMGPGLADICLGVAKPAEFRTEPLMGLSYRSTYLHDGRARTLEEAITAHAGQASGARDRFYALSPRARASLVRYLKTL
jgi:CxxC motif-containing protein (DUF1111 family)